MSWCERTIDCKKKFQKISSFSIGSATVRNNTLNDVHHLKSYFKYIIHI